MVEKKEESHVSKEAVKEFLGKISDEETIEKGKKLLKNSKFEVIFGVILIIGFLTSIFSPVYGGIVVGLFGGLILSRELATGIGKVIQYYHEDKVFKSFSIVVLLLTFLIDAPAVVISGILGMAIRWILQPKKHCLDLKCKCKKK